MNAAGKGRRNLEPIQEHFTEAFSVSLPIREQQHRELEGYLSGLLDESAERRSTFFQPDFTNEERYRESLTPLLKHFYGMLGYPPPKTVKAPIPRFEKVGEDAWAEIYRSWIEVLEGVTTYGIYMVPRDLEGKAPLLIAQHGGGGCPEAICDFDTRINYHRFGPEAVKRGYIVWAPLLLMQVAYGGDPEPKTDRRYLDRRARLVGSSVVGIEVYKIVCGLEALVRSRKEIDAARVGMVGLSYGGYYTLYAMASCPGIKAGVCSGYFRLLSRKLPEVDPAKGSDVCFFDILNTFELVQIVGLICPRPLMIQNGVNDPVIPIEEARAAAPKAASFYRRLGIEDRFSYAEHPGSHEFHNESIFEFFMGHLK